MWNMFIYLFVYFVIYKIWAFYGNLWAQGDHLMETSYLKAHPLGDRYPEWTPKLPSDRNQDSNPCARRSQGPQSARTHTHTHTHTHLYNVFLKNYIALVTLNDLSIHLFYFSETSCHRAAPHLPHAVWKVLLQAQTQTAVAAPASN